MRILVTIFFFLVASIVPRIVGAQQSAPEAPAAQAPAEQDPAAQDPTEQAPAEQETAPAEQETAPSEQETTPSEQKTAKLPYIDCVEKSRNLRMQRRYQEAEKAGRACVEAQQGNPDAWVELGRALAAQGKTDEALEWVNKALGQYQDNESLKLLKARLLAWNKQLSESRALLNTLPATTFERPDAMRLRADVALWDEDYKEAVKWYNRYNEVDTDNPLVLRKRAMAYQGMGKNSLALKDLRKSCEIAPEATNACEARDDFAQSAFPKIYANIFYGYSRIIGRLDGWRLRGAVGSEVNKNLTFMGTWEWLNRPFFDHRTDDWRFNGWGAYQFDSGLFLMAGGGFAPSPTFSPEWNGLAEAGWKFEHFKLSGRFWHIAYPDEANEVLNANAEVYLKPYMLELRYFMTLSPDDAQTVSHSGFGRVFYFFTDLTQFYIGGGGGQKSDYLEPRDINAQSHWLMTAGFRYMLTNHHRFMISVTQRHDSAGTQTYDQTETLLGYEFRL